LAYQNHHDGVLAMRTDLHIHTVASDGCWTPGQVVAEVQARGIGLFAVADHDSIASVAAARALAHDAGLAFLRGVEVSTLVDGALFHVLAYGFDIQSPVLTALLQDNAAKLAKNGDDDVYYLAASGSAIDLDEYAAYTYDRTRGGWRALNFLIDRGLCIDVRDYFHNLAPHIPVKQPSFPHPAEAIAVIRQAGGVPVLAHPGVSLRRAAECTQRSSMGITEEALDPFLDFGIAGLECYSHYHDETSTRFFLDWCNRHGLLITGGSDCHGGFVGRELGVPVVDVADLRLGELEERIVS
jgi:predicted metal-dependent phosphoesterase TrpH